MKRDSIAISVRMQNIPPNAIPMIMALVAATDPVMCKRMLSIGESAWRASSTEPMATIMTIAMIKARMPLRVLDQNTGFEKKNEKNGMESVMPFIVMFCNVNGPRMESNVHLLAHGTAVFAFRVSSPM